MADPKGFLTTQREVAERRPVAERVQDWKEVYPGGPGKALLPIITKQAGRCMDCGIPFCHEGCPLGNRIPDWNDLVRTGAWAAAAESLHATNNFPEFTGRLCPAPCEAACVLGIADDPVTIKQVEVEIANHAFALGYVQPLDRAFPVVAPDQVVPVGDDVAERAALVAERDAAVHAAPGLGLDDRQERATGAVRVDLVPVLDPLADGTA